MSALRARGVTAYVQVSGSEHVRDTRVRMFDASGTTLFEEQNIRSLSKTTASPAVLSLLLSNDAVGNIIDEEDF